MKLFSSFIALTLFAATACLQGLAQNWQSVTGTGTTSAYVVGSVNARQAVLSYINATSDLGGSKITLFSAGASFAVTASSASGQTTLNAVGTGNCSASDLIVIRNVAADTYEVATVSSVTASTVVLSANLGTTVTAGDVIYKLTANGTIALGAATVTVAVPCGAWTAGKPAVVRVTGTSACAINTATFEFKP